MGPVLSLVWNGGGRVSMLSGQCDELRQVAQVYRNLGKFATEQMLLDAADTILELRDDLQRANDENARLREQVERLQPKDCEGNVLDIADTVNMLRSEYDGDHEWDDVVVELALTKWGGDRWIVRGSKGEAWACDCSKTGYDEDVYEGSDDAEPIVNPSLIEVENAKLRDELDRMTEAVEALHSAPLEDQLVQALNVADKLRKLAQRMWRLERFGCYGCRRECNADSCYASECKETIEIEQEMRELGVEVGG